MTARVDIIIPSYNGWQYLDGCLAALERQSYRDFHVIVVDDASSDGTVARLRDRWHDVSVVELRHNVGLATAIDLALEGSATEFVALLNNDTEPEPNWLGSLVAALDRHPRAAAATSKLRLFARRDLLHSAGDTYSRRGRPGNRGVWQRDSGEYDREEEVFGACAGAALYRRADLDAAAAVDGHVLDRDFFMYCEDVDLSWRLRLLGRSIVYVPDAIVFHRVSATGGGTLASYYVARNTICVIVKDLPWSLLQKNGARIVTDQALDLVRTLPHLREPAARARVRGVFAGLLMIPHMLRKRRRIQRHVRADIADIERLLAP